MLHRPLASQGRDADIAPVGRFDQRSDSIFGPDSVSPHSQGRSIEVPMTQFHLGIDVSKAKLDCALRLPNSKFRSTAVLIRRPAYVAGDPTRQPTTPCLHGSDQRLLGSRCPIPSRLRFHGQRGQSYPNQVLRQVPAGPHQNRQGGCQAHCRLLC